MASCAALAPAELAASGAGFGASPGANAECGLGQYWRISSLEAPICAPFDPEKLEYFRYDCQGKWIRSSREDFLAADDPQASTGFFVHGYFPQRRITINKMVESSTDGGWLAYNRLGPRDRPFRLVLWVWSGQREDGSRLPANLRKKLAWAELQGWYLAWVVDQMHPRVPVGLVADSLGAAGVTSALHVLGGGAISGQHLELVHPGRLPLRAAIVAGAVNRDWVLPGHRHGQALTVVDSMLVTINTRDRMLKLYEIFRIGGGPRAIGDNGVPLAALGQYRDRVVHLDTASYVRGLHWWNTHLKEPFINDRLAPYVFPAPPPAQLAADTAAE